jgi:hypothetical protein
MRGKSETKKYKEDNKGYLARPIRLSMQLDPRETISTKQTISTSA